MFRQSAGIPSEADSNVRPKDMLDSAFADCVRQAMMHSVDEEVSDRMQAAWKRGAHAAKAAQREGDESFSSLVESLQDVHSAQHSLEAENERLRQLITTLAGRLSQLSPGPFASPWGLGAGWAPPAPPVGAPSPLPGSSPQASPTATPPLFAPNLPSPAAEGAAGKAAGAMEELWRAATGGDDMSPPHMVSIPAFPFQPPPPPPPAPPAARQVPPLGAKVSLADVLGFGGGPAIPAPETPSTARSAGSEASASWSSTSEDVDAFVFGLTIRLADGTELGLTTSQSGRDRHLRIEGVLPGGAAEAWNRQCGSSGAAEKVLLPGDKITGVNDVAGDPQAMLLECGSRRLLRLQIVRVGCCAPASPREELLSPTSPASPVPATVPSRQPPAHERLRPAAEPAAAAAVAAAAGGCGSGGKALWRL